MKLKLLKKYNTGTKVLDSGVELEVTQSKGIELIEKGFAIQLGSKVKARKKEVKAKDKSKKVDKNTNNK